MVNRNLSIIVPIHNTPLDQIVRCLSSIHDHPDFKVMIYDDNSDDTSYVKELIKLSHEIEELKYLSQDSRHIIYLSPENLKLGGIRNKAIKDCNTDYIYFLDSDDEVVPGALVEMWEFLIRTIELTGVDLDTFYSGITLRTKEMDYENDIFQCKIPYFVTSTMYRVNFLLDNDIKFDESGRKFEDIPFTTKVWTLTNSNDLRNNIITRTDIVMETVGRNIDEYPESTYIYHLEHSGSLTRGQDYYQLYEDKVYWINWIKNNFDLSDPKVMDRLKYESITAIDYLLRSNGLMNNTVKDLLKYHKCYHKN